MNEPIVPPDRATPTPGLTFFEASPAARHVKQWIREGLTEAKARRDLVLRHPDIAAALTEPPIGYSRPDVWTGYIPVEWIHTQDGWRRNNSPARDALITIVEFATAREAAT